MSDRRRNTLILIVVVALLGLSGAAIATKGTKLGLDLKGGVSLIYQARPTKQSAVTEDAIQRSIDIMRERVDQLGVAEPEIQQSGSDQIDVSLPSVKNAAEAERQVGTTAQLWFYDWEPNVLGPKGKPDPTNPSVTGDPSPGTAASLDHYGAVIRASRQKPIVDVNNTTKGQYYGVDDKTKTVICGPQETRRDLVSECGTKNRKPTRVIHVPEGTIVVQAEAPDKAKGAALD